MKEKIKKTILYGLIVFAFICLVTFILLDICEVVKHGFVFGFVFGAIGTLLQTVLYWKEKRFKAWLQLSSAVIYVVAAVLYLIKKF